MKPAPNQLQRYNASERVNHWVVAICFVLLALSGLAFFHPAFFPLTQLFGGGPWTRILHPYIGVVMELFFVVMALRFWRLNVVEPHDVQWLKNIGKLISGHEEDMPEQDKYNAGQKLLFWGLLGGMAVMLATGILMWRAWWKLPADLVRLSSLLHAAAAVWMIGLIIVHIYAAIWTRGTIGAMVSGMVSRAWAKQHHRRWYRKMTGDSS